MVAVSKVLAVYRNWKPGPEKTAVGMGGREDTFSYAVAIISIFAAESGFLVG